MVLLAPPERVHAWTAGAPIHRGYYFFIVLCHLREGRVIGWLRRSGGRGARHLSRRCRLLRKSKTTHQTKHAHAQGEANNAFHGFRPSKMSPSKEPYIKLLPDL